jgi:Tfp pilus assembly protein PilX
VRPDLSSFINGRRQQGVVLWVALIVLVAMTLAGIALVRSVDTSNTIAGNMAFKQGITLSADSGVEAAINWLNSRQATAAANDDDANSGYYANSQEGLDLTSSLNDPKLAVVDWDHNNCQGSSSTVCIKPSTAITVGDNSVSYIIHRLCRSSSNFNDSANSCVTYQSRGAVSKNRDSLEAGVVRFEPLPTPYYRITARVLGPRNTTSFVQTVIHY